MDIRKVSQGKREMIERALGRFYKEVRIGGWEGWKIDCDTLAEQAIVIDAKISQHTCCTKKHEHTAECGWDTIISLATQTFFGDTIRQIGFRGKHGIPGKALAIIVPLEEEDGDNQA